VTTSQDGEVHLLELERLPLGMSSSSGIRKASILAFSASRASFGRLWDGLTIPPARCSIH
jgi:hypothetical protein